MGKRKRITKATPGPPPKAKGKPAFGPARQTQTLTYEEQPTNLSHLVRLVLKALGDPNAKAAEVAAAGIELFPTWKKRIEEVNNWSSYVTQNRDKVAEELGVNRTVLTGGGGSPARGTLSFKDYEAASEFVEEFCDGDLSKAERFVDFLHRQNITRVRVGLKAWCELVESVGSPEAARKALEAMKTVGGVIDR